ncbi:MAG: hypothetical protein HFE49_10895, partial [Clostridia bacterium]|nr:hypothetical protein [Clostridia bacterium]
MIRYDDFRFKPAPRTKENQHIASLIFKAYLIINSSAHAFCASQVAKQLANKLTRVFLPYPDLLITPQTFSFQFLIFFVCPFENLPFIAKLKQMVRFMKFIKPGIIKIFFSLGMAGKAVRLHQI